MPLTDGRKTQDRCSRRQREQGGEDGAFTSPKSHLAFLIRQWTYKVYQSFADSQLDTFLPTHTRPVASFRCIVVLLLARRRGSFCLVLNIIMVVNPR